MKEPFFCGHNHMLKQTLTDQTVLVHSKNAIMIYGCPKQHSKEHLIKQGQEVHIDLMMQYWDLLDR